MDVSIKESYIQFDAMTSHVTNPDTMLTHTRNVPFIPDTSVPTFPVVGAVLKATLIEVGNFYATVRLHGYDGVEAWCVFPEFGRTSAGIRYARQLKRLQRTTGHIPVNVLRVDETRRLADVRLVGPIRIHVSQV